MKNISRFKVEKSLIIPIILLAIISIITIYSACKLLPIEDSSMYIKQGIWFIAGFAVSYFIMLLGNNFIYKNCYILYVIGNLALVALLLFANPINNTKAWFSLPGIGSIQPSEFMKIVLIITLARIIHEFKEKYDNPKVADEFKLLLKVLIIVMIPSILTFLQPDTGVVFIYLLITLVMLFVSGIRFRWFIFLIVGIVLGLGIFLSIYFINNDLFIKIFGLDFFYRINRLLDFKSKSGFQLQNSLMAIGSGGFFGKGIFKTPIYFPEPATDFIFAVFASNFGFIGSLLLIGLLTFLNIKIINTGIKNSSYLNKYVIAGIIGMLIYQQIQNICMTIGLLPITGITLPFISYGGSSLLSYMIIVGILFNVSNENLKYTN